MGTGIGQYAPVFLPGELPSLTEKPGKPQSTGLQRVRHYRCDPVRIDTRLFACDSSAPVRVEREGGAAAWLAETLALPSVQGTDCLHPRRYGPIRVFSRAYCSWQSEGLFGQSFSVALPIQALKGLLYLASLSVVPQVRHIEGSPWVGSYSVVQCIRHLMGLSL